MAAASSALSAPIHPDIDPHIDPHIHAREMEPAPVPAPNQPRSAHLQASAQDRDAVAALLGRPPMAAFRVAARDHNGAPVVIENAPLLDDGTPMPTRFWLVGARERVLVGRLEAAGGVNRAEAEIGPETLAQLHRDHAQERDRLLPADHHGPRPFGGVGGTRQGVKCLHAHYANYLAGCEDPVGRWVHHQLAAVAPAGDAKDEPGRD
ncbi:MAG: DUF501 domain-containing protein [Acidimicrobiales bacterium]